MTRACTHCGRKDGPMAEVIRWARKALLEAIAREWIELHGTDKHGVAHWIQYKAQKDKR